MITPDDLKDVSFRFKGYIYNWIKLNYNLQHNEIYNETIMVDLHNKRNQDIRRFFADKSNFIEINVAKKQDVVRLAQKLGVKTEHFEFPHMNKT